MLPHAHYPSARELQVGESGVCHPQLHSELKENLGYIMKLHLKKNKTKKRLKKILTRVEGFLPLLPEGATLSLHHEWRCERREGFVIRKYRQREAGHGGEWSSPWHCGGRRISSPRSFSAVTSFPVSNKQRETV